MIAPADIRAVAQALRSSDHRYLAVEPADAAPSGAGCFPFTDRTIQAFSYSLSEACSFWPNCAHWSLIGSDAQLALENADWPAGMHALRTPAPLLSFTTPIVE